MSGDSRGEGATTVQDVGPEETSQHEVEAGESGDDRLHESVLTETDSSGLSGTDQRNETESGVEESAVQRSVPEPSGGRPGVEVPRDSPTETRDVGTVEDSADGSSDPSGESGDLRVETPSTQGDAKEGTTTPRELEPSGAEDIERFGIDFAGNAVRWHHFEAHDDGR